MSKFAITIEVKSNRLAELAKRSPAAAAMAIRKAIADIQANARMSAPVLTGNLRNSITAQVVNQYSGIVFVGAEYGIFVEFGTRYMAAHPYFTPAVELVAPQFEAALKNALAEAWS